MAKLVDMAYTKAEIKERNSPKNSTCSYPGEGNKYPYGLTVSLGEDQLKKLGIALPKVGSTVTLTAQCKVVSVRSNENDERGTDRSLELQMQRMAVEPGATSMEDAVSAAVDEADEDE